MRTPTDPNAIQAVIDEGFRRWYESCPCCLSESYPEVKTALDREALDAPAREPRER
jgi:phage terminase large subunit GpA-like protein